MNVYRICNHVLKRHATLFTLRHCSNIFGPQEVEEPWCPTYQPRTGEAVEIQRKRLLYQSRKRGMLENGLLLSSFAHRYLSGLNPSELSEYDKLINEPSNDWDIYHWAIGRKEVPSEYSGPIMDLLRKHARNTDKENRTVMPDLPSSQ